MGKVSFSRRNVAIADLALHHSDVENSLRNYFNENSDEFPVRFLGYSPSELRAELEKRLAESDMNHSLSILAAVEAVFRIDYLQRCYQKKRDPLSRAFREIHKEKATRVNLEEEILDLWKEHTHGANMLIGDLRGALKYRHWLAHGRYWVPKLGRKYDFVSLYALASSVLANLPMLRV